MWSSVSMHVSIEVSHTDFVHQDLPPLEKPKKERSFRLKAISEGVSMMQLGPNSNDIPQATSFNDTDSSNGLALSRHERKQRRKLMKCQSEGVATMRSSFGKTNARGTQCSHVGEIINRQQPKQLETLSELVNLPAKVSNLCCERRDIPL